MARDWEECGNTGMTDAQRRMLNSVCGDLANGIRWHGRSLHKDQWRWLLCCVVINEPLNPGWDYGDGFPRGFIVFGESSKKLTRSQAKDAITLGIQLGDHPDTQALPDKPVRWSDATLHGMGYTDEDLK
jgi:hypothetical protein